MRRKSGDRFTGKGKGKGKGEAAAEGEEGCGLEVDCKR